MEWGYATSAVRLGGGTLPAPGGLVLDGTAHVVFRRLASELTVQVADEPFRRELGGQRRRERLVRADETQTCHVRRDDVSVEAVEAVGADDRRPVRLGEERVRRLMPARREDDGVARHALASRQNDGLGLEASDLALGGDDGARVQRLVETVRDHWEVARDDVSDVCRRNQASSRQTALERDDRFQHLEMQPDDRRDEPADHAAEAALAPRRWDEDLLCPRIEQTLEVHAEDVIRDAPDVAPSNPRDRVRRAPRRRDGDVRAALGAADDDDVLARQRGFRDFGRVKHGARELAAHRRHPGLGVQARADRDRVEQLVDRGAATRRAGRHQPRVAVAAQRLHFRVEPRRTDEVVLDRVGLQVRADVVAAGPFGRSGRERLVAEGVELLGRLRFYVWVSFPPNAAQAVGLLENYDLVALGAERLGRGEAADAAADYRDAFTVRRHVERA
mmetsp:Transcript_16752/g.52169  ORF Transcript_16752/g.52169 Transcript_16752/m.52169 type:complete len:446 (+) Transcript_16752:295-1632(+)